MINIEYIYNHIYIQFMYIFRYMIIYVLVYAWYACCGCDWRGGKEQSASEIPLRCCGITWAHSYTYKYYEKIHVAVWKSGFKLQLSFGNSLYSMMQVQLKSVEHAQDPWYGVKCVGWSSKPRGTCCLGKGGLPHHLLGTSYHIIYSTPLFVLLPCHHIPSCPIFPDPSKSCWSLAWWCEIVSFVFNSLQTHLVFSSDLPIKSNKYGNQDEAIAIEHILMALMASRSLPCDTSQFCTLSKNQHVHFAVWKSWFQKRQISSPQRVLLPEIKTWHLFNWCQRKIPSEFERCHVFQVRTVNFRYRVEPMPVVNGVITPVNGQKSW